MGFTGWLFAHGIDYRERENAVVAIYRGNEESAVLLQKYDIAYVLIGPQERQEFAPNIAFFEERFEEIYNQSGYNVFSVR
jgi:uncharacterized membrane protein